MKLSPVTNNKLSNRFFAALLACMVAATGAACTSQTSNQAGNTPASTAHDSHGSNENTQASPSNSAMVMKPEAPSSITAEHRELHEQLETALKTGGKTGEAAKAVEERLSTHFEKEEAYALPQLGLLSHLAKGHLSQDMKEAIELSDRLKADMPQMLEEHKAIVVALDALEKAANEENKPQAAEFAAKLKAHAVNEEQVTYPAAILVGEYLKLKLKQ